MSDTTFVSEDEYLIREPQAEYKHEYRNGRMVAMSGASPAHNRITVNLTYELTRQLKGRPCDVFASDMRLKVASARFYGYPDVTVVCGEPAFDAKDKYALINPTLIIEVLSKSTQSYDRGEKFGYYKQLDTLQEYVLVDQNQIKVDVFLRKAANWTLKTYAHVEELIVLHSIDCRLSAREVYDKVRFE